MKKIRPILGISLLIQSLTFFILSLINIEKKKALAATFAVLGAAGGAAGGILLYKEYKCRNCDNDFDDFDIDDYDDDFDDLDICEDDILCSFGDDEEAEKSEESPEEEKTE